MHVVGGINYVIVGFFTIVNDATLRYKHLNAQRRFFSGSTCTLCSLEDFYQEMVFDFWCWW